MPSTTTYPFRVVCAEYTVEARSYDSAFRVMISVERLDACRERHTVEMLVDGEWLPALEAYARAILTAKVGAVVDTFDGPLTKARGTWSRETAALADAAGEAGSPEWRAALSAHEEATLTSDGHGIIDNSWHACNDVEQVRYERWSARGRETHGLVCRSCRAVTQTG